MEKRYVLSILLFIGIALFIAGCASVSPAPTPSYYTRATLNHWGFDFSTNTSTNGANGDGHTIAWAPEHANAGYPDWLLNRWWRSFSNTGGINYCVSYGSVELSSITSIPATWEMSNDTPLFTNYCYVSKCNDGYVKFKVLEIGTGLITLDADWPATVEYYFSTGSTFAH